MAAAGGSAAIATVVLVALKIFELTSQLGFDIYHSCGSSLNQCTTIVAATAEGYSFLLQCSLAGGRGKPSSTMVPNNIYYILRGCTTFGISFVSGQKAGSKSINMLQASCQNDLRFETKVSNSPSTRV